MPRTNQGAFKKILHDFTGLESEYSHANIQYFGTGQWNCNYDFFSDFAYTADAIYIHANSVENAIEGMLNSTKFEEKDIKEKYEEMKLRSQQIRYDIQSKFDEVLSMIKLSGGYISDVEQRTLDKLSIYKRY